MFVHDKNKDTPLWIGSMGLQLLWIVFVSKLAISFTACDLIWSQLILCCIQISNLCYSVFVWLELKETFERMLFVLNESCTIMRNFVKALLSSATTTQTCTGSAQDLLIWAQHMKRSEEAGNLSKWLQFATATIY